MSVNKTVKYRVPQQGLYLYARTNNGKTELIVLNSTDNEQVLKSEHYQLLVNDSVEGKEIASGKNLNLRENLIIPARKSMIIEC